MGAILIVQQKMLEDVFPPPIATVLIAMECVTTHISTAMVRYQLSPLHRSEKSKSIRVGLRPIHWRRCLWAVVSHILRFLVKFHVQCLIVKA